MRDMHRMRSCIVVLAIAATLGLAGCERQPAPSTATPAAATTAPSGSSAGDLYDPAAAMSDFQNAVRDRDTRLTPVRIMRDGALVEAN